MNKENVVNELMRAADDFGVLPTLYGVFGPTLKTSVSFSQKACQLAIDELDFSVRASNALKRVGVFTIGEVIDLISSDGLLQIRNLGKKTQNEIKTRLLLFGYDHFNEVEKKRFFYDIVERNCM